MRVLHLIPSMGGGGAERQLTYLARGLRERGVDVHAGLLRGGVHLERLERAGASIHIIRARGNYDPLLVARLVQLIRRVRPDLVQTWLTQMDVAGGLAARLVRVRWIVSERSSGAFYPRDARHALRRLIGRGADAVVANSADGLHFWTGSRAAKFVIANALPLEEIDDVPPAPLDLDAAIILFAGRLDEEKNLPNLIEALAQVMRNSDAVAMLCGAGAQEPRVRARIAELGLADRVRLEGFSDRLWPLMKRADVLVSVSWFEGHPNVVLEAAACGCPLVLSDIAAHRAMFDETSALFAPPANAGAIAAALLRALADRAAARERAARARAIVSQFSVAAATEAYLRVYDLHNAALARH